jgi:beta-mannosidase
VKTLPAIKLYEDVLPSVVDALTDATIPYHRGSPYGGEGWDTADPTVGDVHQWNVWGGKEFPYQDYVKLGGRFVSCVPFLSATLVPCGSNIYHPPANSGSHPTPR